MPSTHKESRFQAQSIEVAQAFLQSVVLLDDKVDMSVSKSPPSSPVDSQPLAVPAYAVGAQLTTRRPREAFEIRLNAGQVIDAFAGIGAVCAVLTTGRDDTYQDRVHSTAMRADIVILDWKLDESSGDSALDVMRRILVADSNTPRLRLISIYTGEPDIDRIGDRVEGVLNEIYDDNIHIADRCHMTTKALRVVILAKPGTLNDRSRALGAEEVGEVDLADKLLEEFSRLATGILPSVALAGATAIRDNAHKMVAQFSQDLDAAYLGHRVLLTHPPDSEEHLVKALGAEILSVLEEANPGVYANSDAIDLWLDAADESTLSAPCVFNDKVPAKERWRLLLKQGIGAGSKHLPKGGKKKLIRCSTEAFTTDRGAAELSNRRFAALLNLKTRYAEQAPRLMIGTVVRIEEEPPDQYLLCLLPKCDSVRLGVPTRVPFVPLLLHSNQSRNKALRFVLQGENDTWVHLELTPKLSGLEVATFKPSGNPPGEIVAQSDAAGTYVFEDDGERRYLWVAALKDEHAFGIAAEVATALVRPGPDNSEWLRES